MNEIEDIFPDSVSSLPSLQTLDLCSNKFSSIQRGTLAAMPRIRRLKLSNNFVSEIDRGALEHLEHLGQLENYIYSQNIAARTICKELESLG